jgi:late competence protein required for DNA uptake (superfamily II DNA/RNA helicase)
MAIKVCSRCGTKTAKLEECGSCGRMLCRNCIKSSRRSGKTEKVYICKDCWSKMEARKQFKKTEKRPDEFR